MSFYLARGSFSNPFERVKGPLFFIKLLIFKRHSGLVSLPLHEGHRKGIVMLKKIAILGLASSSIINASLAADHSMEISTEEKGSSLLLNDRRPDADRPMATPMEIVFVRESSPLYITLKHIYEEKGRRWNSKDVASSALWQGFKRLQESSDEGSLEELAALTVEFIERHRDGWASAFQAVSQILKDAGVDESISKAFLEPIPYFGTDIPATETFKAAVQGIHALPQAQRKSLRKRILKSAEKGWDGYVLHNGLGSWAEYYFMNDCTQRLVTRCFDTSKEVNRTAFLVWGSADRENKSMAQALSLLKGL